MKLTPLILAACGLLTSTMLLADPSWTKEVDDQQSAVRDDNQKPPSPPSEGQGNNPMESPPQNNQVGPPDDNKMQPPPQGMYYPQINKIAKVTCRSKSGQCDLQEHSDGK